MTVEQNIAMGLKQDKLPKNEIADRVAAMLKLVKMEAHGKRRPSNYPVASNSVWPWPVRWRSARSCCCWTSPWARWTKTAHGNAVGAGGYSGKVGVTRLMVTYDQEEAMTMASRIAIMSYRIAQVGSPIDIYESLNSCMTAEFIGSVNIFEANILEDTRQHPLTSDLTHRRLSTGV